MTGRSLIPHGAPTLLVLRQPAKYRWSSSLLLAALALPFVGCLQLPAPDSALSERQLANPVRFRSALGVQQGEVVAGWISSFGDPALVGLVREAMHNNPDLVRAGAVRDEARALIRVAASELWPQLSGFAGSSRTEAGRPNVPLETRHELSAQLTWELDLWGRIRAGVAATREAALATEYDYLFARYSLAATVADAWFLAVAARQQIAIAEELLEVQLQTAKVAGDKVAVGLLTPIDDRLTRANVALAEAELQRSRQAAQELARALEILLGRYPKAEIEVVSDLPPMPAPVPAGLPSELLERRPDIVAADRRVAAAFYNVEGAQAARLPSVALNASLGTLLDPSNEVWNIGANLLAPVFRGGRLLAEVDVAEARQRQALADYVSIALTAFREVEDGLANERYYAERVMELRHAETHLREASRIATDRYEAGVLTIFELDQTRRRDFTTRLEHLALRTEQLRQRLALHLALGGDFEPSTQTSAVAQSGHGSQT